MDSYNGVLYCEAYMNDEFSVADVNSMIEEIQNHFNGNTDVILRKSGVYSVAIDAQFKLARGVKEFRHFVYVVDNEVKRASAEFAAKTYMKSYTTQVAESRDEAYALLMALS